MTKKVYLIYSAYKGLGDQDFGPWVLEIATETYSDAMTRVEIIEGQEHRWKKKIITLSVAPAKDGEELTPLEAYEKRILKSFGQSTMFALRRDRAAADRGDIPKIGETND